MAELENSKDLISVLWSGADILRSKMDANEYKDYLLGIVFYKYLSDSFLIKVYDLIYDEKPENLKVALEAYKEALKDSSAEELKEQIKSECHYVIEPELTYTCFADAARNNSFNREQLQKAFNNIEQSDPLFADLFTDIDLYSNRLGTGDQKQSDTISNLIKEIDKADLLNSDAEILGNAYEYLIGQFASETGKKAGEFYTPQAVSKILTRIAIAGQEDRKGLSVYDPCMGSGSLLLNAKKYAKEPNYIQAYANNDIIDVDETDNVFDLKRKLKSDDRQVIVTTIQKLQRLITKKLEEGSSEYNKIKNLKIAFVVDECHRAVTPGTKRELERFFRNSLWYGFTGTPRFAENAYLQMGDLPRTTEELYGNADMKLLNILKIQIMEREYD